MTRAAPLRRRGRRVVVVSWQRTAPVGPLVYVSARGMLHRADVDGRNRPVLHPRCRAGKPLTGRIVSEAEAVELATGRPGILCRYPWCFRRLVVAAGLDPAVGHYVRRIPRSPRPDPEHRPAPHRPMPVEPIAGREHLGWWWCSCDRIVLEAVDGHNPGRRWWMHKATGSRGA